MPRRAHDRVFIAQRICAMRQGNRLPSLSALAAAKALIVDAGLGQGMMLAAR